MKLKLAALILLIPSFAIADDLEQGENLLTEFGPSFSDYENYRPFSMKEHDTYFEIWKSAERGFSDHYAISIGNIEKTTKTLASFKASQDEPAKRACQSHMSTPAVKTIVNGYDAISWNSTCVIDKLTITSIEMAIMGNDKFYHLRKLWKFPISKEKVAQWQALFSQTNLCDTTNAKHACVAR